MPTPDTLRALAEQRGFRVGAAVATRPLAQDPVYREVLAREFSLVTTENALKHRYLCPARGEYRFADADAIVSFARAHGMGVRGHTLCWHGSTPPWVLALTRPEQVRTLREHIQAVVSRYRGRVGYWDVVNEAVAAEGRGLRDTSWLQALGPQYLAKAFRWAHEADPEARLFYNDYAAEGLNAKSAFIFRLLRELLDQGVPVHGVGLQMHVGLVAYPPRKELAANINRLASLGLEVHITEMDVKIQDGAGPLPARLDQQAEVYRVVTEACLAASGCTALVTWGVSDRYSWIPAHTGRPDAPLLFDAAGAPKPAYAAVRAALAGSAGK